MLLLGRKSRQDMYFVTWWYPRGTVHGTTAGTHGYNRYEFNIGYQVPYNIYRLVYGVNALPYSHSKQESARRATKPVDSTALRGISLHLRIGTTS